MYIIECSSTLILLNIEIEELIIAIRISQRFFLLLILYLFYMAELLNACNSHNKRLNISMFINNITLLIYKPSIESNCRTLKRAHMRCLDWARRYGALFAPEKYDLIHLLRRLKRFNIGT